LRQLASQNNNSAKKIDPVANSPQAETGKTRDVIAEKVGLKSGREAERTFYGLRKFWLY
jgi:serine protease inhibitor ecotin